MSKDGLSPAAYVAPVEEQGGRCGIPGYPQVCSVQSEVRGALEATEKACGPSLAIVEGAASKVTAAVMKIIRRKVWPALEIRGGGGGRVVSDLEGESGAAGGVPFVRRLREHASPRQLMGVYTIRISCPL
jgi:hypothetical protein